MFQKVLFLGVPPSVLGTLASLIFSPTRSALDASRLQRVVEVVGGGPGVDEQLGERDRRAPRADGASPPAGL